jgi:prevent-host-death family protein
MVEYSIAEGNSSFAKIVREAENKGPVKIVRRGKPIAVVLSVKEYERLVQPREDFWSAYLRWRSRVDWSQVTDDEIDEVFKDVRDKSPGRDFKFEE